MRLLSAAAPILGAMLLSVPAAGMQDVRTQTRNFLDAYARGDREAVVAMLDGNAVTMYGSDSAEICRGTPAIVELLANDQRLWGGPATIGEMKNLSIVEHGSFAAVFFDADFSAGGRPPVPVRFATVWRLSRGRWLLVQSSNVVPTQRQSAARPLEHH